MIYAVIDTNVLVSAIITSNLQSPTLRVMEAMLAKKIIPCMTMKSSASTQKYCIVPNLVLMTNLEAILREGISAQRVTSSNFFPDPKDIVFYEVALSKEEAYLVTGNKKHFPNSPIVVSPAEMMDILQREGFE